MNIKEYPIRVSIGKETTARAMMRGCIEPQDSSSFKFIMVIHFPFKLVTAVPLTSGT